MRSRVIRLIVGTRGQTDKQAVLVRNVMSGVTPNSYADELANVNVHLSTDISHSQLNSTVRVIVQSEILLATKC